MRREAEGEVAAITDLSVRARYLGERIDTRAVAGYEVVARSPHLLRVGNSGWVALLRYGVVVSIGLTPEEENELLSALAPHVSGSFDRVETEGILARVDPNHEEGVDATGIVRLKTTGSGRLAVLAEAVAKSTALAHYESEVGGVMHQLEPLVEDMRSGREAAGGQRRLLSQLGEALKTQARVIGRVEVREKPELTWDDPTLNRLYERLAAEFELEERDHVLTRKTDFLSESAGLLIDMARHRQTLRVEWYIVILILIEIVLLVFDLMTRQ